MCYPTISGMGLDCYYNPFVFGSGLINRVLEARFPGERHVEKTLHQT